MTRCPRMTWRVRRPASYHRKWRNCGQLASLAPSLPSFEEHRDGRRRCESVQRSSSYSPLLPLFPVPSCCEFHIGNYLSRPRVGHVRMKSLRRAQCAISHVGDHLGTAAAGTTSSIIPLDRGLVTLSRVGVILQCAAAGVSWKEGFPG